MFLKIYIRKSKAHKLYVLFISSTIKTTQESRTFKINQEKYLHDIISLSLVFVMYEKNL